MILPTDDRVATKKLSLRFVPRRLSLASLYNERQPAPKPGGQAER